MIKTTPVCPFCATDMAEQNKYLKLYKAEDIPSAENLELLHYWVCEGCGFVALWKGRPK